MCPGEKSERLPYQLESRFRICDYYGFLARLLLFVPDFTAPILRQGHLAAPSILKAV